MKTKLEDASVLPTPAEVAMELPLDDSLQASVAISRRKVRQALHGQSQHTLVITGPCSLHNTSEAIDYARRLSRLATELDDSLTVVMRAYFEKPRTTIGWKGLINDPDLDGSCDMAKGLRLARQTLIEIVRLGLPICTELLDPNLTPYLSDLLSMAVIGARTTESQIHRELASSLGIPVGFKNGTDGNIGCAVDAIEAAKAPHTMTAIDTNGRLCRMHSNGNPDTFLILRGGRAGPNTSAEAINDALEQLRKVQPAPRLVVDCSHANSGKDHRKQGRVFANLIGQIAVGSPIAGVMLESYLNEGAQKFANADKLAYGVSVTDSCIGWKETEQLLRSASDILGSAQKKTTDEILKANRALAGLKLPAPAIARA